MRGKRACGAPCRGSPRTFTRLSCGLGRAQDVVYDRLTARRSPSESCPRPPSGWQAERTASWVGHSHAEPVPASSADEPRGLVLRRCMFCHLGPCGGHIGSGRSAPAGGISARCPAARLSFFRAVASDWASFCDKPLTCDAGSSSSPLRARARARLGADVRGGALGGPSTMPRMRSRAVAPGRLYNRSRPRTTPLRVGQGPPLADTAASVHE